ncbi:MAG: glycoside hydrolase family 30 protein [Bacteroidales bacterium]|nr:glycoside hydrolase family 30 protein [Bacteroidales bacterium]
MKHTIIILSAIVLLIAGSAVVDNDADPVMVLRVNVDDTHQVIHNFGASDAWSIQFVGTEWPESSRKQIAELLFSTETDPGGNPKGIGLSAWRFNIGGGSAGQGEESRIRDPWRRAECFLNADGTYDWSRQEGQMWFLQEAKKYGVADLIGFVNSPPVHYTKNGKAWSDDGLSSNLPAEHYEDFAVFLAEVVQGGRARTGITFDYISPFNEPQWEWKCCKQEGSPWNNDELARATRVIDRVFSGKSISDTKIEVTEAGQIDYLYDAGKSPGNRSNQVEAFFDPASANYIGNLEHLAPKIAGHSYFSTWNRKRMIDTRLQLREKMESVNDDLEYWVTEYCILENNREIRGNGMDLGMDPAIYVARVIHADLVHAEASAWQWWLAVSPYDYKDGLIYISKVDPLQEVRDSKMLWALGNYARFIRPGSIRIGIGSQGGAGEPDRGGLHASAFLTPDREIVVVMVNEDHEQKNVRLEDVPEKAGSMRVYHTTADPQDNLRLAGEHAADGKISIPPRSVVTCVISLY